MTLLSRYTKRLFRINSNTINVLVCVWTYIHTHYHLLKSKFCKRLFCGVVGIVRTNYVVSNFSFSYFGNRGVKCDYKKYYFSIISLNYLTQNSEEKIDPVYLYIRLSNDRLPLWPTNIFSSFIFLLPNLPLPEIREKIFFYF